MVIGVLKGNAISMEFLLYLVFYFCSLLTTRACKILCSFRSGTLSIQSISYEGSVFLMNSYRRVKGLGMGSWIIGQQLPSCRQRTAGCTMPST
ncbi:hypothetical protein QL093DRAFT_2300410 [Fusarium oxysporum]|nr:hypothetical protein QL093DRAFT_2300410 [Fusarium oxysporum]